MSVLAQLNCSGLAPGLKRHLAGLADQRQVFGVVDRKLHGIAGGDGREIDVLRPGRSADAWQGQANGRATDEHGLNTDCSIR